MAGETILIIEDDAHIGGLVSQVLREAGLVPALVRDMTAVRAWRAAGNAPAALLSDLMVPGSPGPDRLAAELGSIFPDAPLALITGVPRKRRSALGVTHERIIEKPFEIETLLEVVHGMLPAGAARPGDAP